MANKLHKYIVNSIPHKHEVHQFAEEKDPSVLLPASLAASKSQTMFYSG